MKKCFNVLCFAVLFGSVFFLFGCFAGPQMRMYEPQDSSEYAGATVFVHELEDSVPALSDRVLDSTNAYGGLAPLISNDSDAFVYRIGPLDEVQVVVWEHPELTSPMGQYQSAGQTISTSGTLFYPYAGELKAAGLTAQELRAEITARLSDKILTNPQVDVKITGYNSLKSFVSGEVKNPGFVAFNDIPLTLPEALTRVGGLSENADASNIMLRRAGVVYTIDYLSAFKSNLPLEHILLKPGDQLWVPSLDDQRVYVLGEVGSQAAFSFKRGRLSLMEAVTRAGGLQAVTASARSLYVIRNTSLNRIDVFHLDAKNAMAFAVADRFALKPRDIVYVDASGLATWNRIISQILPTVQTVYYGVMIGKNINDLEQE